MTIVTKLTLESGDRDALDGVVEDIRAMARRKGVEFKGPHAASPVERYVPQYKALDGDETRQYDPWRYSVYGRRIELVGSEDLPRRILNRGLPDSVHIEVEIEHRRAAGG